MNGRIDPGGWVDHGKGSLMIMDGSWCYIERIHLENGTYESERFLENGWILKIESQQKWDMRMDLRKRSIYVRY